VTRDITAPQVGHLPVRNLMSRWGGGAGATAGGNPYASGSFSGPKFEEKFGGRSSRTRPCGLLGGE
jgi:hypothetical protein